MFSGGGCRSGGLFCGGCRCGDGGRAALCALCGTRVEEFALSGEVGFPRLAISLHQRLEVGIVAQVVEVRVFVDVVEIGVLSALQRTLQIGECLLLVAAQCVETSRVVGVVLIALGHDGVHACDGRFRASEEIEGKGRDEVIVGRFFEFQLAAEVRVGTFFLPHFQEQASVQVVKKGRFLVERKRHVHGFHGGFVVFLFAVDQGALQVDAGVFGIDGLCAIQCRVGFVVAAEVGEQFRL